MHKTFRALVQHALVLQPKTILQHGEMASGSVAVMLQMKALKCQTLGAAVYLIVLTRN